MIQGAAGTAKEQNEEEEQEMIEEEEEVEEAEEKAWDWKLLQREKSQPKDQSLERVEQRRALTVQDEVTRPQQLQTLQQVEQLHHATVLAAPSVHHPVRPLLLLLSQPQSSLVVQHHGGCEAGRGNARTVRRRTRSRV